MKSSDQATQFGELLAQLKRATTSVEASHLTESQAENLIRNLLSTQRSLGALQSRCTQQLHKLKQASRQSDSKQTDRDLGELFAGEHLSRKQVSEEIDKAKALDRIVGLDDSLEEVTASNFQSIARQTAKLQDEELVHLNTDAILDNAKSLAPDQFERELRNHIERQTRDRLADTKAKRAASNLKHWMNRNTGMGHIHAELDPERYERFANQLEREIGRLGNLADGKPRQKNDKLAADAFCNLIGSEARTGKAPRHSAGTQSDLLVLVDLETLRSGPHTNSIMESEAGTPLAAESVSRLACDATIRTVTADSSGAVLNVGRKYRTATDAQWAAMKARYSACAWDGCSQPISWCQLHHIQYWRNGGNTNMDNLVPLCSRHHHQVHEGRWSLKLLDNRALEHYKPDGRLWKTTAPPTRKNQIDTS